MLSHFTCLLILGKDYAGYRSAARTGMLADMPELLHTPNDKPFAVSDCIDGHVEPAGEQAFLDDIGDVTNYLNDLFINYLC